MRIDGFTGGEALQTKLQEILRKIKNQPEVKVGFLEGATYPDGTPVAMVAALQNFGAPAADIPARPFFSNMVREKSPNWGKSLGNILATNNYDAKKSLSLMGEGIGSQLQESIQKWADPANADLTIAKKGFNKPLIDTAHMINSVGYEVDGEKNLKGGK